MRRWSILWVIFGYMLIPVLVCGMLSLFVPQIGIVGCAVAGGGAALSASYFVSRRFGKRSAQLSDAITGLSEHVSQGVELQKLPVLAESSPFSELFQSFQNSSTDVREQFLKLLSRSNNLTRDLTRFQSILGSMIEGVVLIDSQGRIRYGNRSAAKLLDRKTDELEGRQVWEVFRTPELHDAVTVALSSTEELRREFELQRTSRVVELSAVPLEASTSDGILLVFHDVTELRRLERMRQEFVSNVSHELKTPLTAIQAYADTLQEGAIHEPEHALKFVGRIQEQAEHLQNLIQDMLRLARIESQRDAFLIQPVELQDVIIQCADKRQPIAVARQISLNCFPKMDASTLVNADAEGLRTIFDNLIGNALNYTPDGGHVDVRLELKDHTVIVEIEDNGIGIPSEHHERIFERFYRVDKARSRGVGGTGLGLAIVKHYLMMFSGEIEVESKVGRGTLFCVRLPLLEPPVESAQPVSSTSVS